jgi:predicted membrane channel-forming protein YqfA (hemolysin III family)
MNTKMNIATLLFLLMCVMEIAAVIEYFRFPKVPSLLTGLAFALTGGILFVCSVRLYRSGKRHE